MTGLFHAHSGLRFLILLLGLVNVVLLGVGLARGGAFGKLHRALGSAYVGLMHTQVLIGAGLVAMGRYYPQLIGHFVLMSVATVVAQVALYLNKKRPEPGFKLPLLGIGGSLLLIVGGILAISRGVFEATAFKAG